MADLGARAARSTFIHSFIRSALSFLINSAAASLIELLSFLNHSHHSADLSGAGGQVYSVDWMPYTVGGGAVR